MDPTTHHDLTRPGALTLALGHSVRVVAASVLLVAGTLAGITIVSCTPQDTHSADNETSPAWAAAMEQLAREMESQATQQLDETEDLPGNMTVSEQLRRWKIVIDACQTRWDRLFHDGRAAPTLRDRAKHEAVEDALRNWKVAWANVERVNRLGDDSAARAALQKFTATSTMEFATALSECSERK